MTHKLKVQSNLQELPVLQVFAPSVLLHTMWIFLNRTSETSRFLFLMNAASCTSKHVIMSHKVVGLWCEVIWSSPVIHPVGNQSYAALHPGPVVISFQFLSSSGKRWKHWQADGKKPKNNFQHINLFREGERRWDPKRIYGKCSLNLKQKHSMLSSIIINGKKGSPCWGFFGDNDQLVAR